MWARACSNIRGRDHPLNRPLRYREAQSRAHEQTNHTTTSRHPEIQCLEQGWPSAAAVAGGRKSKSGTEAACRRTSRPDYGNTQERKGRDRNPNIRANEKASPRCTVDTAGFHISYKVGLLHTAVITRSDFKPEAIFGFPSPNYTCECT